MLSRRFSSYAPIHSLQSQTIPHRDDPRYAALAKRCEQCRPLAMFKPNEDEFLLCYDGTKFRFPQNIHLLTVSHIQNLVCTLTDTETQAGQPLLLSGREQHYGQLFIDHTCCYSTAVSLKCDTWKPVDSLR